MATEIQRFVVQLDNRRKASLTGVVENLTGNLKYHCWLSWSVSEVSVERIYFPHPNTFTGYGIEEQHIVSELFTIETIEVSAFETYIPSILLNNLLSSQLEFQALIINCQCCSFIIGDEVERFFKGWIWFIELNWNFQFRAAFPPPSLRRTLRLEVVFFLKPKTTTLACQRSIDIVLLRTNN